MGFNTIPEFIRIEHTLEAAMVYNNSAQEDLDLFYLDGIQLLPNNIYPYIQRTHNPEGIEIEDWQVSLMDLCGNELFDVTDYFDITRVFQDLNGLPQVEWSLTNVPYDASNRLVYLRILQGANDYMYSSPFRLTAYEGDYTSRWDYKDASDETFLSIQLSIYNRQPLTALNLVNYDDSSTGKRRNQSVTTADYQKWKTKLIDKFVAIQLAKLFTLRYVYCDFQRAGLYDTFEVPQLEYDENFLEFDIMLTRDSDDVYDPLYVQPPLPVPPQHIEEIILNNVSRQGKERVRYEFSFVNFTPYTVLLEYSTSVNGPWTQTASINSISPKTLLASGSDTQSLYYRVSAGKINSNILQLPIKDLTIGNITASPGIFIQTGNQYTMQWQAIGYTPGTQIIFEGSTDGTTWQPMYYGSGNQNPKVFQAPSSAIEFKYFRIKDNSNGIVSAVKNFEI